MDINYDPKDLLQHIGEALGLLLVAIAQEHDDPHALLDRVQAAEQKCLEFPAMYAPQTRLLLRFAGNALAGSLQAASDRNAPN